MSEWMLGVIGGSGLYAIDALEDIETRRIDSPWGKPSDDLVLGRIGSTRVAFLPRHGRNHTLPPSRVNYRANIAALKFVGCTDILSVSAVGSLQPHLPPGSFIAVDQFIDRTYAREKSFFEPGCVAHVSIADPVCPRLSRFAVEAAREAGATVTEGGAYLCMEGPQFSTRAESRLYRQWGCDVIGMTNMPEAKLAREAELPYASMAMATDFDSWHLDEAPVDVAQVSAVLRANAAAARRLVEGLARKLDGPRAPSPIDTALDGAIMTPPSARDPELVIRLKQLVPRAFA